MDILSIEESRLKPTWFQELVLFVNCPGITDAGLEYLERLTKLRRPDLRGSSISDQGLFRLANLTELRELSLGRTSVTRDLQSQMKFGIQMPANSWIRKTKDWSQLATISIRFKNPFLVDHGSRSLC
jgi:hypothetical protein